MDEVLNSEPPSDSLYDNFGFYPLQDQESLPCRAENIFEPVGFTRYHSDKPVSVDATGFRNLVADSYQNDGLDSCLPHECVAIMSFGALRKKFNPSAKLHCPQYVPYSVDSFLHSIGEVTINDCVFPPSCCISFNDEQPIDSVFTDHSTHVDIFGLRIRFLERLGYKMNFTYHQSEPEPPILELRNPRYLSNSQVVSNPSNRALSISDVVNYSHTAIEHLLDERGLQGLRPVSPHTKGTHNLRVTRIEHPLHPGVFYLNAETTVPSERDLFLTYPFSTQPITFDFSTKPSTQFFSRARLVGAVRKNRLQTIGFTDSLHSLFRPSFGGRVFFTKRVRSMLTAAVFTHGFLERYGIRPACKYRKALLSAFPLVSPP